MPCFLRGAAVPCIVLGPGSLLAEDRFFDSNGVRIRYVEQVPANPSFSCMAVRFHYFGGERGVGPVLEQHFDRRRATRRRSEHQRRLSPGSFGFTSAPFSSHTGVAARG